MSEPVADTGVAEPEGLVLMANQTTGRYHVAYRHRDPPDGTIKLSVFTEQSYATRAEAHVARQLLEVALGDGNESAAKRLRAYRTSAVTLRRTPRRAR